MLRIVGFIVFVGLIALGASWLVDRPGDVSVVWQGYRIETSVVAALVAVLAVAVALGVVWALLRYVFDLPGAVSLSSRARRREKGIASVSRGLIAIGSGDSSVAHRSAGEAERLLGREPLALLLKAQAAQMSGDRNGAEKAFTDMLETAETRVLGLRGLFVEARRKGDDEAARAYAQRASELAPKVAWASEAVLEYQSADRDWRGALETLERQARQKAISSETAKRLRAVLLTADALSRRQGDPEEARRAAREAVKLAPDLVPASVLAGRLLSREGALRKAAKILESAWKLSPHPEIASAYLDLRPADSARDRLERAKILARLAPENPESRFVKAFAALEARDFNAARAAAAPLLDGQPTVRTCLLMADIAEAEHGTTGEWREWIGRASRARRDPAWVADGVVSDTWLPVSPVTGRLDAFRWSAPAEQIGPGAVSHEDDRIAAADAALNDATPNDAIRNDATLDGPASVLSGAGAVIAGERAEAATAGQNEPTGTVTPEAAAPVAVEPATVAPVVSEAAASAVAAPVVTPETAAAPEVSIPPAAVAVPPAPVPDVPAAPLPAVAAEGEGADEQTVVFPLAHAPDDPGPDAPEDVVAEPQRVHLKGRAPG